MAETIFGTSDPQTVKLWSKTTFRQALAQTLFFKKFLGKEKDSILYWKRELEKEAGDQIKYDLLIEMKGDGSTGDNEVVPESLIYEQDSVMIDQLRHGHAFSRMSQQRTVHDLRKDGEWALARWWATRWETDMFRALCGDATYNHAGNTGTVADSDHVIYGGDATSEDTIGSNDQFTLELIDYAKEKAATLSQPMVPVRIEGDEYFVVVLHPYSVTDMKLNLGGSTSAKWMEIQQYANVRGLKNPIFNGSLGVYNKCIIFESKFIHTPSTGIRRNLFLGSQAGVFAMGNPYDKMETKTYGKDNFLSWVEDPDFKGDFKNKKAVSAGSVFGIKKCVFDSDDFGVITMPCYAAAK